jgi:succinate dehydrogenase/fumarate reductase flavoprotein subunit
MSAIWVNAQSRRFTCEYDSPKKNFPALMAQEPATYWAVFDETSKKIFFVSGSHWADFNQIEKEILDNPDLVKTDSTIEGLAGLSGLPTKALVETVQRYNEMVDKGVDVDFDRFGPNSSYKPTKIVQPPFYAVQLFPLTRKSMGGVVIDMSCRVLDQRKHVIPGLYAVGELTGQAGINGKAAIEGTFLGMCIITGRIAGRSILSELKIESEPCAASNKMQIRSSSTSAQPASSECMDCHDFDLLLDQSRPGYWHFNKSHYVVQERKYQCAACHSELYPYQKEKHQMSALEQIDNCAICHGVDKE